MELSESLAPVVLVVSAASWDSSQRRLTSGDVFSLSENPPLRKLVFLFCPQLRTGVRSESATLFSPGLVRGKPEFEYTAPSLEDASETGGRRPSAVNREVF